MNSATRKYLPVVIVATVGLATLIGARILYRAHLPAPESTLPGAAGETASAQHSLGPAGAAVTIEEFGDFQCPPCGILAEPLNQMIREFKPHARLVFRNLPLAVHAHSREAAVAAEAAGLQGKFWEMHDLLYREQATWSKAADAQSLFNTYANMIGLNAQQFSVDTSSEKVRALVGSDEARAKSRKVQNTPTIFLNGVSVSPNDLAPPALHQLVVDAIQNNKKP